MTASARAAILAYLKLASLNQEDQKDVHHRSSTVTAGKSLTRLFSLAGSITVQEAHQSKRMRSWTRYGIAYACKYIRVGMRGIL